MAENRIELKSVGELLGMSFFIPSYQRGYRWTEQQVKDLLNDVNDYKVKDGDFYCLQPLVVKRREGDVFYKIKNEANNLADVERLMKGSWEVIDGQQRLTTIYIILSCLNQTNLFHLEYATRKDSQDFLRNIDETKTDSNIDYCYIVKAKQTTQEWVEQQSRCNKEFVEEYKKKILNSVQFIWHQTVDENTIEVFTRLNIGRISLTNAELIKALFLNQSNFPSCDKNSINMKQQEIASEWDNIEYTLQNDEFWLFLHKNGYDRPTRIDFIFDMICKQNAMKLDKEKYETIGTDGYRTFRYFYEYFKQSALDSMYDFKQKTKIELCWNEVKKYFQTFQEWFNDLEMYHYVGVLLSDDFNRRLSNIVEKWTSSKKEFLNYLKTEITKEIKIPDGKYFCDDNHIEESLHFDSDKKLIRKILLMHNIQTVINQNKQLKEKDDYQLPVFYKFPFHLFKKEVWNVEHIDSNTSNELTDLKQQHEWLLAAWIVVVNEDLKETIRRFIQGDTSVTFEVLYNNVLKEIGEGENKLNESERMRIWNLALLDETTNKGYHNDIFSLKRKCLIGKDQGEIIDSSIKVEDGAIKIEMTRSPASISFIPVCTKNAFLKYYTPATNNLMDWDKTDATEYKKNILETLTVFGVNVSSNNQNTENNGKL